MRYFGALPDKSVLVHPMLRFTKKTDFLLKLSVLRAGVLKYYEAKDREFAHLSELFAVGSRGVAKNGLLTGVLGASC